MVQNPQVVLTVIVFVNVLYASCMLSLSLRSRPKPPVTTQAHDGDTMDVALKSPCVFRLALFDLTQHTHTMLDITALSTFPCQQFADDPGYTRTYSSCKALLTS